MHLRNQPPRPTAPPATTEARTPARTTGQVLPFPTPHMAKHSYRLVFTRDVDHPNITLLHLPAPLQVGDVLQLDGPAPFYAVVRITQNRGPAARVSLSQGGTTPDEATALAAHCTGRPTVQKRVVVP